MLRKHAFGTAFVALTALFPCSGKAEDAPPPPPARPEIEAAEKLAPPKYRIMVSPMENRVQNNLTGWDLGSGMTEMLTSALLEHGNQVQVLEWQPDYSANLRADKIGGDLDAAKDSEPGKKGAILPQYIIKGAVTDFVDPAMQQDKGGKISIGKFSFGIKSKKGKVGIDIRIVDAISGEVVKSKHVEKPVSGGKKLDFGYGDFQFGTPQFKETPLGQATQESIAEAVSYILAELGRQPWRSKVLLFKENTVFIRGGEQDGIKPGMRFQVYKMGEPITDPETGEILGGEKTKVCVIEITAVKEKISEAKILDGNPPTRGDAVEYLPPE